MSAGLFTSMWYGGLDVIQHYTLRLVLWRAGETPRNLARFLDHCIRLVFLQRVGGGYVFIHRLLLEHFAAEGGETNNQNQARPKKPGIGIADRV